MEAEVEDTVAVDSEVDRNLEKMLNYMYNKNYRPYKSESR